MHSNKPSMSSKFEIEGSVGPEPLQAKKQGTKSAYKKENATLNTTLWNKNRDKIMYNGLEERFKTDEIFRKILQRIKDKNIHLLHFDRFGANSYRGG
jgi:hypothetical protein